MPVEGTLGNRRERGGKGHDGDERSQETSRLLCLFIYIRVK